MKVLVTAIVGIIVLLGAAGAGVLAGIVPVRFGETQANFQGQVATVPPLQPLNAQVGGADMVITLSERFLNQQIGKGVPQTGEVSNAQIDLHSNSLANFTATVKTGFLTVQPNATVQFSVQNSRIVIDVLKVDVGGFGVPSSLIQPQIDQLKLGAEAALNSQFADLQKNTGLKLQSVSTTENSLTLNFAQ